MMAAGRIRVEGLTTEDWLALEACRLSAMSASVIVPTRDLCGRGPFRRAYRAMVAERTSPVSYEDQAANERFVRNRTGSPDLAVERALAGEAL